MRSGKRRSNPESASCQSKVIVGFNRAVGHAESEKRLALMVLIAKATGDAIWQVEGVLNRMVIVRICGDFQACRAKTKRNNR